MFVTYKPPVQDGEEVEEQRWAFIPEEVNSFDAEAIEMATGWTYEEFLMYVQKGSMKARRTLLWILLRNIHRGLALRDVHISKSQLSVDYDKAEYAEIIKSIQEAPEQPGVNKEAIIDNLTAEMDRAPEPPDGMGKAHSVTGGGLIALPSHRSASTQ
jgi:hypothetical protein